MHKDKTAAAESRALAAERELQESLLHCELHTQQAQHDIDSMKQRLATADAEKYVELFVMHPPRGSNACHFSPVPCDCREVLIAQIVKLKTSLAQSNDEFASVASAVETLILKP